MSYVTRMVTLGDIQENTVKACFSYMTFLIYPSVSTKNQ
jgi:hypothetical protein